jgi:hypothetical protein
VARGHAALGWARPIGKVEVGEREIRVGDKGFHAVVDVRRDRAAWPRALVVRETEQIGVVERRRGVDGRPRWALLDATGDAVATVRESSFRTTLARRSLAIATWAGTTVVTLGHGPPPPRRPRTEFVVSGPSRALGVIQNGSVLDLSSDPGRELDRRLGVGAFVAIVLGEEGY